MRWMFNLRRACQYGLLGINRRNLECILEHNARSLFPVVDDKLAMHTLCDRIGVPSPEVIGVFKRHSQLRDLEQFLRFRNDLVIKPARGSGGRGILVLAGRSDGAFLKANGQPIEVDAIRQHISDILSGTFSLGEQPDCAILQKRIQLHPVFRGVSPRGIPDIRLVLYRFELAMAMLRLPTLSSNGRANLHQGGIGAGLDLATGRTRCALHRNSFIERHPDTGEALLGLRLPRWGEIVDMSRKAARAIGLGFVGIDIVIDELEGPMLLEANARPGLAIQLANNQGLRERIDEIEEELLSR